MITKNKLTKIISFILVFFIMILASGCNSSNNEQVPEISDNKKTFVETGINLVDNGVSNYRIVIPAAQDSISVLAANELTEFMFASTGVMLTTITDSGIKFNELDSYIFIGETSILEDAGITVSKDTFGESDYILKTIGNSLIIASVSDYTYYGSLYGTYDFMEYTIGFKVYASDEIVYKTMDRVPLYAFDEHCKPSIDLVELGFRAITSDSTFAYRLRSIGNQLDVWSSFAHSLIGAYLPYSTYGAAHPDWYINAGEQLCLSNEEMIAELVLQVEKRLMAQYYGAGSTGIKKYYNLLRAHYKYLDEHDYTTGKIFFLLDDANLWPIGLVRTILGYLDEAMEALEPLKETDPDRYEVLYSRIQRERLSPIYMMLQYYINQLSDEVKASYIEDFETYTTKFAIEASREGSFDVANLIESWKKV